MNEATIRLRNQVAVLLACNRTRLDKSRWSSVQRLLQQADGRDSAPGTEWERRLLAERDSLRTLVENTI